MKKDYVNIGIIGACGLRMTFSHLPNLQANPLAHFRAFCDLDEHKARKIAKDEGYTVDYYTDDVDELMRDDKIDLLIAGLPHEIHEEIILKAVKHGKDIFIEKPMVLGIESCQNVLDAIRAAKIRVMIGHNRRFAPTFTDAKHIYDNIMHGKPCVISYRVADPLPRLYKEDPALGGRIYGEQCHFFDLLSWFTGSEPIEIYTIGNINDHHISIKFENGSIGVIISSAQGGAGYPKEHFECFADNQTIVVEGNVCLTHCGPCQQTTVKHYPLFFDPYPGLPGNLEGYRQRMANYGKDQYEGKFKVFSHPSGYKGHYEELDACIKAILGNKPFPANETDGARAVYCCAAAVESINTGKPVSINKTLYT